MDVEEIKSKVRLIALQGSFFPILCGTSFKNKGVKLLLDAVINYLPSPNEIEPITGVSLLGEPLTRVRNDEAPFSALAFKIINEGLSGKLTFLRIYSGVLKSGTIVLNANSEEKERIQRVLQVHANKQTNIGIGFAGDIVAVIGLKNTKTGDTLCEEKQPIILESIIFPEPVISLALEPESIREEGRLRDSLLKISEEDPTFKLSTDKETSQIIISGMGKLHLEHIVGRIEKDFKGKLKVGKPLVAYRETIRKSGKSKGVYQHQSGGHGNFAIVYITFEPNPGKGFEFVDATRGMNISSSFVPYVKEGLKEGLNSGILAGYQVIDVKCTLTDGEEHVVDSAGPDFHKAAINAIREIQKELDPVLLEPIMDVEIILPMGKNTGGDEVEKNEKEMMVGKIISDLGSRRGEIKSSEMQGTTSFLKIIRGTVPLAKTFDYDTELKSLTKGGARFSLTFATYREVPTSISETIINSSKKVARY
jgi:elongation factor G